MQILAMLMLLGGWMIAVGGLVTLVFIIAFIVTATGPEAKGVSFRKEVGARG